jgi:hypothetical protein
MKSLDQWFLRFLVSRRLPTLQKFWKKSYGKGIENKSKNQEILINIYASDEILLRGE